jgi:1,4-alpha-glucan branching enzyme
LLLADLNAVYAAEPALHRGDSDANGIQWVESGDAEHSVYAWMRIDPSGVARPVLAVFNATPAPQHDYRVGVPREGRWLEVLNSDADTYGGSGVTNPAEGVTTVPVDAHGFYHSIVVSLPPLGAVFLVPEEPDAD